MFSRSATPHKVDQMRSCAAAQNPLLTKAQHAVPSPRPRPQSEWWIVDEDRSRAMDSVVVDCRSAFLPSTFKAAVQVTNLVLILSWRRTRQRLYASLRISHYFGTIIRDHSSKM
ncbi:uncharacterized protein PV07_05907 [Cladophialophora immunda]|uniref:Uncharacterized protein n=1 Tax=Cladophialophora immunda TaxID=569365 RepID=A0A0D2CG94_9EURO|nr:uncharacterized protein PV07_05907 [Cladophialophora immunda]KIW30138.1 hypothetical protein PV07_05907 [Cladophialophora immunda]